MTGQRAKGLWLTAALLAASVTAFGAQPADTKTSEAAIMKADRDFNQAVQDKDLTRFLSLVAEDASFESAAARGRKAVQDAWASYFQAGGPQVVWQPVRAEVLVGGDVGYTLGTWVRTRRGQDGTMVTTHGDYLTVWRKQMDGAWRAIFDTGSTK